RVVTTSFDGTARVWDARTGAELWRTSDDVAGDPPSLSLDGRRVATVDGDSVVVSDSGNAPVRRFSARRGFAVANLSLDGEQVLTQRGRGSFRVYDVRSGKLVSSLENVPDPSYVDFSASGPFVVGIDRSFRPFAWSLRSGERVRGLPD